jgi:hypothetical protein
MTTKSKKTLDIFIDAFLVIIIASGIILTYIFLSANLAYGLAMLIGVWFIDAYLKKSFEYPNETLFADLSFAALFFFGGQKGVDILSQLPGYYSSQIVPENPILPIIIGLGIAWLGNLRLCRGLLHPEKFLKSRDHIPYVWAFSFVFSLISIAAALLPQILEVLK